MTSAKKPDLLLINPGNRSQVYQSLGRELAAIESPVWVGLMACFVRNKKFSVEILDANAEGLGPEETARRVSEINPLLAAVIVYGHQPSASTQNMPAASAVCSSIRQKIPTLKILLAGGHVAALPERTLREENVDFVSDGECLYTLTDLLSALKSNRPADLEKVRGLWYRQDGIICSNPAAPLVKDLDAEIPQMTWDLLPMNRYRAHNWHCFGHLKREPYAALYTTLGCPYRCSFCCIHAPFKSGEKLSGYKEDVNTYRYWSPQAVIAQIDCLVNQYGVSNIKIADEMFVLNEKHVEGICDLIIERGYKLNLWAYARVDTLRKGLCEKMKRAGINWLAFGIEAGSSRVRDDVHKGFTQEDIFKAMKEVTETGIHVIGNYIFGLPEDDLRSMQETLDLALTLNCEFANFYCTMAYPGSDLYRQALKEGRTLPKTWSGYSQHSEDMLPLPTKYLTSADVIRFRDQAFQTYFTNPGYLEMIQKKFGAETESHIRRMASHKLVRKFA